MSKPDQPTQYFPPVNIINIQSMVNSQIQQSTYQSHQQSTITSGNQSEIKELIKYLRPILPNLNLDPDTQAEVEAEINTLDTQLTSPKPKEAIIKESLKSIRNILEGATGSILASEALTKVIMAISNLIP